MKPQATLQLGPKTIRAFQGNIVRVQADAIVNAANSSLLGGGGVDGAIHAAAGPKLLEDCRRIVSQIGGRLPAGQAVATGAGNLKARYVIHTVGPIWHNGYDGEPETLAGCYRESMNRAEELQLHTIAFPAISTGAYGYPFEEAAEIAIRTIAECLSISAHVREVSFVLYSSGDYLTYEQRLDDLARAHGHEFKVAQSS